MTHVLYRTLYLTEAALGPFTKKVLKGKLFKGLDCYLETEELGKVDRLHYNASNRTFMGQDSEGRRAVRRERAEHLVRLYNAKGRSPAEGISLHEVKVYGLPIRHGCPTRLFALLDEHLEMVLATSHSRRDIEARLQPGETIWQRVGP